MSLGAVSSVRPAPHRRLRVDRAARVRGCRVRHVDRAAARVHLLPFTTLMWLLVGAPPQGVEGLDWLWIVLAVVLDAQPLREHLCAAERALVRYGEAHPTTRRLGPTSRRSESVRAWTRGKKPEASQRPTRPATAADDIRSPSWRTTRNSPSASVRSSVAKPIDREEDVRRLAFLIGATWRLPRAARVGCWFGSTPRGPRGWSPRREHAHGDARPVHAGMAAVDPADVRTKRQLATWVRLGATYARSLPAKR